MNRPVLFLLAASLAAPALAQERHASPDPRPIPETAGGFASVAPGYEHLLTKRPRHHTTDAATGRLVLTAEARAAFAGARAAQRSVLLDSLARLPQTARPQVALPPTVQRGGALVFTVNSAYDNPDEAPGDGVCKVALRPECTLRAAIEEAVALPDAQPVVVEFGIVLGPPGSYDAANGAWITFPGYDDGTGANGPLPFADHPNLTIDATTQGDTSCGSLVAGTSNVLRAWLDGQLVTGNGLDSVTEFFVVRGLLIRGFENGVLVAGPGSLVECNRLIYNFASGVAAYTYETGGAPISFQNNSISGNRGDGAVVSYDGTRFLLNLVGTDTGGTIAIGNAGHGIAVYGDDVVVSGNVVSGNGSDGILLDSADRADVVQNTVGLSYLRQSGSGLGNGTLGIRVTNGASANDIGRPDLANFVANSADGAASGIAVTGTGTNGNRIRGNVVGLTASAVPAPNYQGIFVGDDVGDGSPSGTIVGGPTLAERNVTSGNDGFGVVLNADLGTLVEGNTFGLDESGAARPNALGGIGIAGSTGPVVRGNTASGNAGAGVILQGGTSGLTLAGNRIGTDAGGTLDRGNGADGILCFNAHDVMIGGTSPSLGNTIAFNGTSSPISDGVFTSDACTNVAVLRNAIFANAELGIDHCLDFPSGCDIVTPNDSPDADGITNYPVITSATNDGTNATVTVTLSALPNQAYRVELFRSGVADPSGYGEGQTFITSQNLTTGGSGTLSAAFTRPVSEVAVGSWATATATPIDGSTSTGFRGTSEFSQARQVTDTSTPPGIFLSAMNTTPLSVAPGGSVSFSYTIQNNTPAAVTGDFFFRAVRGGATVAQGVIVSGTLPAGQTVTSSFTQGVPSFAPPGAYAYTLRIGQFPSVTVDSEAFTVVVTGSAREGDGSPEVWAVIDVAPWVPVDGPAEDSGEAAASRGDETLPSEVALAGAYPNPFSRSATVGFALPEAGRVRLAVYDVLGREVVRLVDGEVEAGRHEALLDGASLPAGVYLVRLVTESRTETQRITLVR